MHPIFIDTEFSVLTQNATLLSLALVPRAGPWFYAVFNDVDTKRLSPWHQKNIVPYLKLTDEQLTALPPGNYISGSKAEVLPHLLSYLTSFKEIVIWADVPAYDWVLFCELFGGALTLPKNIHYIVRDLATLIEAKGYDIDTDRFALAYGNGDKDAAAMVKSSDGRIGENQVPATTVEGLLRHNALGDALACRACYLKIKTQ